MFSNNGFKKFNGIKVPMTIGGVLLLLNIFAMYVYNDSWHKILRRIDVCIKNIPEILCVFLTLYLLKNLTKKKALKIILNLISTVAIGIYLIQFIYLAINGEFISILAMENIDQVYLFLQVKYIALLMMVFCLLAFVFCFFANLRDYLISKRESLKLIMGILLLAFIVAYQNLGEYAVNSNYAKYFKHVHTTPLVGFCLNIYNSILGEKNIQFGGKDYAFQKNWVFKKELTPIENKIQEKPNVILIFTEGTSTRLLGCYGGERGDLTINIDDFAKHSLVIDNYYNHTAATFRGTLGQLASCFPYRGGGEHAGGWGNKSLTDILNYQTVPKILSNDYNTYFYSPHTKTDSYTNLLKIAGFQNIETTETIDAKFSTKRELVVNSIKDDDMYAALIKFLNHQNKNDKPFFLAMYTVGTHAGFDTPSNGLKYSKGDNSTLNTLYNVDHAFGKFWKQFQNSPYKDNTIIIFTADHTHAYEKPYVELMKNDPTYKPVFTDTIPLIIYDPFHEFPSRYDANDDTSLALAPTILHLLNYNNVKNAFLGTSIFDNENKMHIHAEGNKYWYIFNHRVYGEKEIPSECLDKFIKDKEKVLNFYSNERNNRMIK